MKIITPEQFKAERIALRKPKCNTCKGTGVEEDPTVNGLLRRIACRECQSFESRLDMFCRGFFNPKYVAPRYWNAVYLSKLEPNPASLLPLDRQARLLKLVKENPEDGYALFGAPQTGKSTIAVGLYSKALYSAVMKLNIPPGYRVPVRRIPTKTLLDQQQVWAAKSLDFNPDVEVEEPEVTRDKIIRCFEHGNRYSLFLEEIDKVKETEVRRANLFETLDMLHGCMGQLVITSNLTLQQFEQQMGGDFMHRITAMCKIVNLYD